MANSSADHDLKLAVMEAMWPLPCVNPSYCTREELEHQKSRCAKWREWVEYEAVLDADTRRHYLNWVQYCEYQNARGAKELVTQRRKKSMEEYDQRQREQAKRVAQIVVPKPAKPLY